MYKKHLGHFVMVSLKYFFDFDYTFCRHAYMIVLMIPFMFRMLFTTVTGYLYDGLITVKEDSLMIKNNIIAYKQHWDNSGMRVALVNNARSLKNNIFEKSLRIR